MARRIPVDLYCEDSGHELFVTALIRRLAAEEDVAVDLKTRNSRGGHGRAVTELKVWQQAVARGQPSRRPELLVLVIDCNSAEWSEAHKELQRIVDHAIFPRSVVGCPDPHVERWCIADPSSFREVIGVAPLADPGRRERSFYKKLLRESILAGDQTILTNEMEFAPDLVRAMDFYRVGKNKNQRSLKLFIDDLRKAIRSLV